MEQSAVRRGVLCLAALLVVVLSTLPSGIRARAQQPLASEPGAQDISPEALAQIEALLREKESRSSLQQKIDSQLIYELKMQAGQPIASGIDALETDIPYADDGHAIVDVKARITSELMASLSSLGVEVLSSTAGAASLRLHVDIDQVEALAALPDVVFVQPKQEAITARQQAQPDVIFMTGQGSTTSEGDRTHLAFAARGTFGADGTGVKIGVLSNGVTNLAASQASGDLGSVTVLPGQAGSGDEGTAMLEIVHDLAPGAQLYFATGFNGIANFARNIRDLRTAGCDIIVDDVFYFVETPFQDGQAPGVISNTNGGVVIQAVKDVVASGAMYFSSAGNSGNLDHNTSSVWEGDFVGSTDAPQLHTFSGVTSNLLLTNGRVNLYWSDPLGGSANDYDLFALNNAGTAVVVASTNIQSGTQDPYEDVGNRAANQRIVIVKKTTAAGRFLHLNANRGRLSIATAGQTHGHATVNSIGAFGVAATPAGAAFPNAFTSTNSVETFSSDGPRRIFFQSDGAPITPGDFSSTGGQVLSKPDLTAADGVSVTGAGGFPSPFFGTSAATPHAAAIAALVKSADPAFTVAQIRSFLTSGAIDIEAPGVDRDSGAGIVMPYTALLAAGVPGTAFVGLDSFEASENPGNANGRIDAGEGARLTVVLKNYGVQNATGISAVLVSSIPGVAVTLPNGRRFPDLPVAAAASNASPLLFTVASDLPCPTPASLTLTVNSSGGSGPKAFTFQVPVGPAPFYSITTKLDTVPPPASAGVTTATGVQNFRLNRQDTGSVCGSLKPPPPISIIGGPGARQFDSYTFTTCGDSAPTCAAVTFSGPNSINMFTATYVPAFNPADITQNYKADPAVSSTGALTYSFSLPGGSSTFAIDVHDVPPSPLSPSGSQYSLTVSGACLGACDPPNHVPIAKATDVTVFAGAGCTANASIDDGSSDADADVLTIAQSPTGPYPLGTTSVQLTVTDPKGATSQATGTVTVLDNTPPSIVCPASIVTTTMPGTCSAPVTFALPTASDSCSTAVSVTTNPASGSLFSIGATPVVGTATDAAGNSATCPFSVKVVDNEPPSVSALSLSAPPLWPPNHQMVDVTVNYGLSDNCEAVSCVLTVSSNEPQNGLGDGDLDHDWEIVDAQHVRVRAERSGKGNGRVYTVTLTCTDAAGNKTVRTGTLTVPHNG
jgi:hypothetical protein